MKVGGFGGAIVDGIDNTLDRLAEYTYDYEWLADQDVKCLYGFCC